LKANVEVLPPGLRSQPAVFFALSEAPGVDRIPGAARYPDTRRRPTSPYEDVGDGF
jgi:hypothetical protein